MVGLDVFFLFGEILGGVVGEGGRLKGFFLDELKVGELSFGDLNCRGVDEGWLYFWFVLLIMSDDVFGVVWIVLEVVFFCVVGVKFCLLVVVILVVGWVILIVSESLFIFGVVLFIVDCVFLIVGNVFEECDFLD